MNAIYPQVSVPIRMPHGDCATVIGVFSGTRFDFSQRALRYVADINLMAQIFHQTAYELFDEGARGIGKIHLTNSPTNMHTWVAEAHHLRLELPFDVQETLIKHENAATLTDPKYIAASRVFMIVTFAV